MPVAPEKPTSAEPNTTHPHPDDVRMSFGEHLEELRKRILLAGAGVLVGALVTFYFGLDIIHWLEQPLHRAQVVTGQPPRTVVMDVQGAFGMYMKVSLLAALVLVMPWVIYQLWKFIAAGLYWHERRIAYILAPFSATMTVLGVLFAYYMLLPVTLSFFLFFADSYREPGGDRPSMIEAVTAVFKGEDEVDPVPAPQEGDSLFGMIPMLDAPPTNLKPGQIWHYRKDGTLRLFDGKQTLIYRADRGGSLQVMPDIQKYFNLILVIMLGVIVAFQMPVVMTIAGWTGLVDPSWLASMRKYAIFVIFAAAAILTPADVLSMFVLAAPMLILFEMGLLLMRLTYRKRTGDEAA